MAPKDIAVQWSAVIAVIPWIGLREISTIDNLKEYPASSSSFVVRVGNDRLRAVCWRVVNFDVNFPGNLASLV